MKRESVLLPCQGGEQSIEGTLLIQFNKDVSGSCSSINARLICNSKLTCLHLHFMSFKACSLGGLAAANSRRVARWFGASRRKGANMGWYSQCGLLLASLKQKEKQSSCLPKRHSHIPRHSGARVFVFLRGLPIKPTKRKTWFSMATSAGKLFLV